MVTLADGQAALAAEWQAKDPQTPEEIATFYRDSEAVAADLEGWHSTEGRKQATDWIVHVATVRGVRSVLDVGCGRGDDLAALAGIESVTVLEGIEPNAALRLQASERIDQVVVNRDIAAGSFVSPSLGDLPIAGNTPTYDLTLLMDVLEHQPDAPAFLARVLEHIPLGGALIEHSPTWDVANPTHLRVNWGWSPGHQLRRTGFQLLATAAQGMRLWERVATHVAIPATFMLAAYRSVEPHMLPLSWQLRETGHWNMAVEANDALVQRARSTLVSKWWREDHADVFLMVDADMQFSAQDAAKIVQRCREGYKVICGAYPVRGGTHLSSRIKPGQVVVFEPDAEPVEIDYAATGFLAVHRDVIDALRPTLPIINAESPSLAFWPFFDCSVVTHENGNSELLSEDWYFSKIAREAGFPVYLDPSIRLGHIGSYAYELEDFGRPPKQAIRSIKITEQWSPTGTRQHPVEMEEPHG